MNYRIVELEDGEYALLDDTDTIMLTDEDPARLSKWAFARDAQSVRHDYSLVSFNDQR